MGISLTKFLRKKLITQFYVMDGVKKWAKNIGYSKIVGALIGVIREDLK